MTFNEIQDGVLAEICALWVLSIFGFIFVYFSFLRPSRKYVFLAHVVGPSFSERQTAS